MTILGCLLWTGQESKKPKLEDDDKLPAGGSVLDLSKPEIKIAKTPSFTAKDKARAKAAGGSKSISSFFKKI